MIAESITLSAAFILGFSFGAGACNVVCLPYLAPIFFATGGRLKHQFGNMLWFSAGRLTGYTGLGFLAGGLGAWLEPQLESPWVQQLLGLAAILIALQLLFRAHARQSCLKRANTFRRLPGGLFLMGLGLALNPCAPLHALLLTAAASGDSGQGLLLGLAFGSGAVIIPTLLFSGGVAYFAGRLRLQMATFKKPLEYASASILLAMGAGTFMGWIVP